ncbi:hypothetical protein BJV77DRAFT_961810 [Russula vinacea]|nr:hypothetical protein BJV77DRAFT_961810 [Russula vinacea]
MAYGERGQGADAEREYFLVEDCEPLIDEGRGGGLERMFIIVKERLQRLEMTQVWARYDDGVQDGSVIVRLNAMVGGVGLGSKQSDAPMPSASSREGSSHLAPAAVLGDVREGGLLKEGKPDPVLAPAESGKLVAHLLAKSERTDGAWLGGGAIPSCRGHPTPAEDAVGVYGDMSIDGEVFEIWTALDGHFPENE